MLPCPSGAELCVYIFYIVVPLFHYVLIEDTNMKKVFHPVSSIVGLQITIVLPNLIRQEFSLFVNKSKDIETSLISSLKVFIFLPVSCLLMHT